MVKDLIEKLLTEVDPDIRETMLAVNEKNEATWEWLPDAANTILRWQEMRQWKR